MGKPTQLPPDVDRALKDYEVAASSPETDAAHYERYRNALRAAIASALGRKARTVKGGRRG